MNFKKSENLSNIKQEDRKNVETDVTYDFHQRDDNEEENIQMKNRKILSNCEDDNKELEKTRNEIFAMNSEIVKDNIKEVDWHTWKDSLPQVHWNAINAFRDLNPSYYINDKGEHLVIYTEDGERLARRLYIVANNAGISGEIDISEILS